MNSGTVFVVDDSASVRDSLSLMLQTAGFAVECHASAEDFLAAFAPDRAGCIVLDLRMPGMGGIELQSELAQRGSSLPVIFLSAYGDVPTTVRAIHGGAQDFLTKPVDGAALIGRVRTGLEANLRKRRQQQARRGVEARLERLSLRERQILGFALAGNTSGEIGRLLDISPRTVETHRARVLLKLGVRSLLEFTQTAATAGVSVAEIGVIAPAPLLER